MVGFAGVATAVGAAAIKIATDTATAADEIDKMSQRAGMSKTAFQEWQYVLSQNGIETDKLVDATKTLAEQMFETSEEGQLALDALGISFEGMNKEEAFNAVITSLQGVADENEKCKLAAALLGEGYVDLMPLLNQTTESTDALKSRAHELGMVMSDDAVNAGVKFGDTLADLKGALGGVFNEIGSALLPILTELMSMFLEYMPTIKKLLDTAIVPLASAIMDLAGVLMDALAAAFEYLMPVIENIMGAFSGLIDFISGVFTGNWSKAWQGITNIFGNIFGGIKNLLKEPINWIIGKLNSFLQSLNRIKIPDWVPGVGGKGFNIPSIPMLASGGEIVNSGAAIVGEAGAELIELPKGAKVKPLTNGKGAGVNNITQNNYFTQKELTPYQAQLEVKRLSRNLAGAF